MQQRTDENPKPPRAGLLDRFFAPWRYTSRDHEILTVLGRVESAVTSRIPARLSLLEALVANTAPLLNKLAEDMAAWAAGPFAELLAENVSLRAERDAAVSDAASARGESETLRAEDVEEDSAAERAVAQWNSITAPVTESPEVPVEIPPVEVPAEPTDETPAETPAESGGDAPPAA